MCFLFVEVPLFFLVHLKKRQKFTLFIGIVMLPLFELRTIGSSVIFICFKRAWVIFLLPLPLSLSLSALAFKREVAFVSIQRILDHKPMSPNLYKHHRLCYRVICTPLATKTFIKCNSLSLHGTKIHTHTPNPIASSQVLRQ